MENILEDIRKERERQDLKFGADRDQHPAVWLTVLTEEVGEVAQEICDSNFNVDNLKDNYRVELIQVAAVAVAAIQNYDNSKK